MLQTKQLRRQNRRKFKKVTNCERSRRECPPHTRLSRGPGERAAAGGGEVGGEYGLAGAGADGEDGAVSLLDVALASDLGRGEMATADDFGVGRLGFFWSSK